MQGVLMRYIKSRLTEAGYDEVTIMHGWMLGYLYEKKEMKVNQRDFERSFGIARSTVANIMKHLEGEGYITRTSDEADSRFKLIELTEKGEQVHNDIKKIIVDIHEEIEDGITPEEKECFYRIIEKMLRNMNVSPEEIDPECP